MARAQTEDLLATPLDLRYWKRMIRMECCKASWLAEGEATVGGGFVPYLNIGGYL